jgi:hypothetical protein
MRRLVVIVALLIGCNQTDNGLWKNGKVPFIMAGLSQGEVSDVLDCMMKWEFATIGAIKFEPARNLKNEYLLITHSEVPNAAEAYVEVGDQHVLYITSSGDKRAILHGFGHVLGLIHEHQRMDRDSYITVNIYPGNPAMVNMQLNKIPFSQIKYNPEQYPYDYKSLMHYREEDVCQFAEIDGHGNDLGNDEISFLDALKVLEMYSSETGDSMKY